MCLYRGRLLSNKTEMKLASFVIQSFKIVFVGLHRKKSGEFWWSNGQLAEVEDGFWANQSPILSSG